MEVGSTKETSREKSSAQKSGAEKTGQPAAHIITRKDIADELGVSVSVVSRALNNSGYVSEEKRRAIIRTAERLGYVPHPVAMSLQERRTKHLLFYCKDLDNEVYIEMYRGMCQAADRRGYMVTMNGRVHFDCIKDTMVDGIIMPNEALAAYYLKNAGKNYVLPAVSAFFGAETALPRSILLVEADMYSAMELGIRYLTEKGHRRIAFAYPYPADIKNPRLLAFRDWSIKAAGRAGNWKDFVITPEGWLQNLCTEQTDGSDDPAFIQEEELFARGVQAASIFAGQRRDVSAVIGFNDEFSLGMVSELQRLGIRVPGDVSVLGIDGTRARKYVTPLLSSVNVWPQKIGRECAELLMDKIEKKNTRHIVHVKASILEGDSVWAYSDGKRRK